jgi:hypothetical protein
LISSSETEGLKIQIYGHMNIWWTTETEVKPTTNTGWQ